MNAQIRLGDLEFLVLGIALLILIIYGILVLKNVYVSILKVRRIIEKNEEHIDKIISQAPSIVTNVKEISTRVSGDVKSIQKIVEQIIGSTETAAGSITKNSDLMTGLVAILQIAYIMKNFIHILPNRKR